MPLRSFRSVTRAEQSARGYHRKLRVARTLADLDGEERVARIHIAEALSYRGETSRRAQAAA
jgi:magnesium chelatase family protein